MTEAIADCEHFVMAGSMDSFHEYFDPYFELVVHLHTDAHTREKRVHERAIERFGDRVLEGGDMHEDHQKMLTGIAGYDYGIGGCTLQQHEKWIESLECKALKLNGADALEQNLGRIIDVYRSMKEE